MGRHPAERGRIRRNHRRHRPELPMARRRPAYCVSAIGPSRQRNLRQPVGAGRQARGGSGGGNGAGSARAAD